MREVHTTPTARPVSGRHGRGRWRFPASALVVTAFLVGLQVVITSPIGRADATAVPVSQASTSTRGVTSSAINVAFPVVNLTALASTYGFAGDVEYTEQAKAIHLFVDQINSSGGINGRKINAVISSYNPASDAGMQALCDEWTQGSPGVFAVLDGVGTFTGDNQLCVTQQGHTPFLSQWTTVSNFTQGRVAVPVVDRTRRCGHPAGAGHLGEEPRHHRRSSQSGGHRR